ncbi:GNAT family N-acetyltransferase [Paenibacillus sp. FSL H7-0716]|uniref:GNAT family N-acetyltransferase n=1 Tax=Paenibacillus odorifer TaxID=189426 RepID=A0A1R0YR21_9BACL|nr:GNAT family N-acetyltransferase [Paenibacillus odorifer]AWV33142.1 GNAT family N-acetyltransferase [Paenibacillus odorifer]OME08791.1 GNAT family N-acetyltransferase [Paenibacillus odorifer]OME10798.1 GNAT family N-acetyltransferase [Paenibacillus odorifer]
MVVIKEIEIESLPELGNLYQELMNKPSDLNKLEEVFKVVKADNRYILLGAFVEGKLLGSLMGIVCQDLVGDCKPFMVIENVVVSARARRQGVGKKLMNAIEQAARERDCYYIILVSGEQRKEAHVFYESLGYRDEKVEGYRKHLSSH